MKTALSRSRLIDPSDAPQFQLGDLRVQGLAAPSRGARETSIWRLELAPGAEGVPHTLTREEIFYAMDGEASVTIDGTVQALKRGCALVVPAHTEFAIANPHDVPFIAMAVLPVGAQAIVGEEAPFTPPWAA